MGLLKEIQKAVVEGADLGPILLKLRFLAAKLGSHPLEEWVKYESEGYPIDAELPDYRLLGVSYIADFSGPFGSGIKNAPIPPYLINKFAGERWNTFSVRQSISGIEQLENTNKSDSTLRIDASNLIMLLQGNVYEGYGCVGVTGRMSTASLSEIKSAVRNRILGLTLELEKTVPGAEAITMDNVEANKNTDKSATVNNITHQVVYGTLTSVENSGAGANVSVNVSSHNKNSIISALENAGFPSSDAKEFAEIVASEAPEDKQNPFGARAKAWVGDNLKKAVDGTWKVGIAVASQVLSEAASRYYGLK